MDAPLLNILAHTQVDISKISLKHNEYPSHHVFIEKFAVTKETKTIDLTPDDPAYDMPSWLEFRLVCECGMSHTITKEDKANIAVILPPKDVVNRILSQNPYE